MIDTITLNENTPLSKQTPKRVVNVEMFRAGEQTDSDGDRALFTTKDLDDTISTYDPKTHEAPLIVGHEQDDSTPSLGWVRSLWRKGQSLWGKIELTPRAEKLISDGIFKKVSVSFYAPSAEANPYPGKLSLRHLALVNIPAVKGLAEFTESTTDTINVDFSEQKSKALFKELLDITNIMAKPRKKSISNHAEGPMHVTINVGGSGNGTEKNPEDIALYDDGGNQMSPDGIPTSFYEDEDMLENSAPEYADDEEEFPDLEGEAPGGEAPEGEAPEDETLEGEAPEDETLEDEAPEGEMPEDEAPVDDISEEMDDDDEKINQLAANYSALDLAKALMIQKQSSEMMESPDTSDMKMQNFSEEPAETMMMNMSEEIPDSEDEEAKKKKKPEENDDESAEYAEEEKDDKETPEFGCDDKKYSEDGDEEDEEDDASTLKDRVAQLEKELAEQRKMAREKEISDFCEKVYGGGKLTEQIVPKKDLVKFMSTLNGKNSVNFSEGGRKSQFDFFSEVLANLPQLVNFSEFAHEASAPKKKNPEAPASGFAYDNSNLDVHSKALEFSEAKGVDYITALKSVIE